MIHLAALPVLDWIGDMLARDFVRHAFLGGTGIALAAGLVGYLVVLRNQVFTGDALSHVAFTGALAAFAAGVEPLLGLFGTTVIVALGMALLGGSARARDVVVGVVFAWVLGLGVLFLSIYTTSRSSTGGAAGVTVLFGSIYGLSLQQAVIALCVGIGVALLLGVVARPLLFASIDADVAASRGVPVRALSLLFLALVARLLPRFHRVERRLLDAAHLGVTEQGDARTAGGDEAELLGVVLLQPHRAHLAQLPERDGDQAGGELGGAHHRAGAERLHAGPARLLGEHEAVGEEVGDGARGGAAHGMRPV